ncbi:hypothetical protein L484_004298 [Morus notabilis]|uniref:Uncharacterized protein n=1 Tax=Morus notabilis TaxID=981085 RepID=W9RY46_9ROSA|nr:hypothetical protein L484_004298 [Morus notabilis]
MTIVFVGCRSQKPSAPIAASRRLNVAMVFLPRPNLLPRHCDKIGGYLLGYVPHHLLSRTDQQ